MTGVGPEAGIATPDYRTPKLPFFAALRFALQFSLQRYRCRSTCAEPVTIIPGTFELSAHNYNSLCSVIESLNITVRRSRGALRATKGNEANLPQLRGVTKNWKMSGTRVVCGK